MLTVSVHIVTYNSEKYITSCLESIFRQTYPIDQIIIVDNASVDDTINRIMTFEENRITLIRNKINNGFAGAHNQAINLTNTDWILILNPDVILDSDYVMKLIQFINGLEHVGAVTGKLLLQHQPDIIDSTGLIMTKARRAFDRGANCKLSDEYDRSSEIFGISGAAGMYSRKMINALKIEGQFFDEDFFAYKEDVDVAWRSQIMGWKAYYVPEAIGYHERGWKQGERNKQPLNIRSYSYINRYLMLVKNDRLKYILLHLPWILAYEILSFVYVLLKEPRLLGSWGTFFSNLHKTIKKRKIIQSANKTQIKTVYRFFQ